MSFPDNDDFVQDEPLPLRRSRTRQYGQSRLRGATRKVSTAAGDKWKQTSAKASAVRERTEFFLRENPVPTILGALALGLAIGFAIRYASAEERREAETKSPIGRINWSMLSLPFFWPLLKSVREKYEDSAEAVRDRVHQLKSIDIDDYIKPIRRRWKW